MSDETKSKLTEWMADLVKSVGFPIMVSCAVLYFGFQQIEVLTAESRENNMFIRERLTDMVADNTAAVKLFAQQVEKIAVQNQQILTTIEARNK